MYTIVFNLPSTIVIYWATKSKTAYEDDDSGSDIFSDGENGQYKMSDWKKALEKIKEEKKFKSGIMAVHRSQRR